MNIERKTVFIVDGQQFEDREQAQIEALRLTLIWHCDLRAGTATQVAQKLWENRGAVAMTDRTDQPVDAGEDCRARTRAEERSALYHASWVLHAIAGRVGLCANVTPDQLAADALDTDETLAAAIRNMKRS